MNFVEVRSKEFINIYDGKLLGRAEDILFEEDTSSVKGFSVPTQSKGFFKKKEVLFIPINKIIKIGEDVVLVNLEPGGQDKQTESNGKSLSQIYVPKKFARKCKPQNQANDCL